MRAVRREMPFPSGIIQKDIFFRRLFLINHTFSHLPGVGEKLEQRIWRSGVLTWDDFLAASHLDGISAERKQLYDQKLAVCREALNDRDAAYLAQALKRREHWRLFEAFRGEAVCLDIETSGFHPSQGGYPTVVGLHDGFDSITLVHGENLTVENLNRHLAGYKMLITFYGAGFDVPFLNMTLPGVRFDMPHFDLCFAAKRLDIKGGLKRIETQFGMIRDSSVQGMNGYDAVLLWERARHGDFAARERLLTYNREDTAHLLPLADILYEKMCYAIGIADYMPAKTYGCN